MPTSSTSPLPCTSRHVRFGLLMLLGLLMGPAPAWSQDQDARVHGSVRDAQGVPLPGVNVWLEETPYGAATSADGRYTIVRVPAGRYTIVATAIGFRREARPLELAAGATATVDFVLDEITLQSGEVVVTAARREQLASGVPLSISTLTPRDLQVRNVVSLDDALRYVPGVQLAGNQVNVRGSSGFSYNAGSRVLLLVDGMPMLRPDAEGIAFDAVPATQIERIEVVKGPGSALYGGGALGGVINIITKDFPETPETSVRLYGGAYEPVRYDVWRERWDGADDPRPFGGTSVAHARRLGDRFGFWVNLSYWNDTGYLRLDANETVQGFAKLGWRPSGAVRLDLLTGLTRRQSDAFLYWNGARDALNPGVLDFAGTRATGGDDNLTNELALLPSLTHVLRADLFYSVKGRLFGVLIQPLDEEKRPKPLADGTAGFRYGGEVQLNWTPGPGRYLTAGVSGDANATRSSFFDGDDALSQPEGAVFAQWEQALFDRLNVVAGLRLDTYRIRAGNVVRRLSPKLNVAYPLGDGTALRVAYGHGFRVPSVTERYISDRSYFPVISNLGLRPEESISYEAGVRTLVPVARLSGGIHLDVAVFRNSYRHLVEPVFVPRQEAFQFVNLTRARIRGLEATLGTRVADDRLTLQLGYTLLDADDLSSNQPLAFRSRHLVQAALQVTPAAPFELGLDYRLASRPERVDTDFARFVPDAETMVPTRVLDVRIGTRWRGWHLTLITNNALEYYYLERPALLAPPRHYTLQLVGTI